MLHMFAGFSDLDISPWLVNIPPSWGDVIPNIGTAQRQDLTEQEALLDAAELYHHAAWWKVSHRAGQKIHDVSIYLSISLSLSIYLSIYLI